MKAWHFGLILAVVVAYLIGVKFPAPGNSVFSAVGM